MEKIKSIKCEICGKFIGYKEIDDDKIIINYTPDSEYTIEKTDFTHKKCVKITKN